VIALFILSVFETFELSLPSVGSVSSDSFKLVASSFD